MNYCQWCGQKDEGPIFHRCSPEGLQNRGMAQHAANAANAMGAVMEERAKADIERVRREREELKSLREENEKLREALEFYADTENYDHETGALKDMQPRGLNRKLYSVLEFGERARAALENKE